MTDREINFHNMALDVHKLLRTARPQWEPLYRKLLPDFTLLDTALDGLAGKVQKLEGQGSTGYTTAKDLATIRTLDAAMPVLQGIKALVHDGAHPGLTTLAEHTRSSLDNLRDLLQVAALEELHTQALAHASDLADEMVTANQIKALDDEIALYKPLVGTPHQQISAGVLLRDDAAKQLGDARKALKGLDVRMPNLQSTLPDLVAAYQKAREIVDAGRGPQAGVVAKG